MKKQGYNDRLDESLGMKRGKEADKMQSYKSRRDESRGMSKAMKSNERYMPKGMKEKVMGHEKMPKEIYVPCGDDLKKVKPFKSGNLGYPDQAFGYDY